MNNPTGSQLLTGSGLFLALVVYINVRLGTAPQPVDWTVMTIGALVFFFALVRYLKNK